LGIESVAEDLDGWSKQTKPRVALEPMAIGKVAKVNQRDC
jgi:hypothetical protein